MRAKASQCGADHPSEAIVVATKGKTDLARRRRWSRRGVIAWIIYRQHEEVQRAEETVAAVTHDKELAKDLAETKKPLNWSLVHVVQGTHTPRGRIRELNDPAKLAIAVVEAEAELSAAEKDGRLLADANGLYSSASVKKLFPSKEGYGRKRQPRPYVSLLKAEKLGRHGFAIRPSIRLRSSKTTRRGPHPTVHRRCRSCGLGASENNYFRGQAA